MCNHDLHHRREKRRKILEREVGCQMARHSHLEAADKPRNGTKGTCSRCGKEKRIESSGMCSRCYNIAKKKGVCEDCGEHAVLRAGKCDSCYRHANYSGRCEICNTESVLKKGICPKCYSKQNKMGICRTCGAEDRLTNGLCQSCWDRDHRGGSCSKCGHEGPLRDSLCSTCYKKKNNGGECKICKKSGSLTDGMCGTCYNREHYRGLCDSCGSYGQLTDDYCRTCWNSKDTMSDCAKCHNHAVIDQNGVCGKCSHKMNNVGICSICGKERPIVFGQMCRICYADRADGVRQYMRSSIKRVLQKLLGKDNFEKDSDEIFLRGIEDPFQADFELRDLTGRWCPAQYFNSKDEWSHKYGEVEDFKVFYEKYLRPKNYIMFTSDHSKPVALRQYLIDRNFLQPDGQPYGKPITERKEKPALSKRDSRPLSEESRE